MKTIFLYFLSCFIIGVNVSASSSLKGTTPNIHWGHLINESEEVVKIYFNIHINQICREKTKDITIDNTSIFNGKAYVSIISPKFELTYDETEFYREDRQGKLHKMPKDESIDKVSIALLIEKGKATEIKVDFPQDCPTGDYLLKIKVHNEQDECYEIYQWFEAYTSKQNSLRKKPIPLNPDYEVPDKENAFEVVQNMPEFPGGGMPKLMEFIQNNLQYNKAKDGNSIKKRVIIQVIIDKDGTVTNPIIIRGVNPTLDREALRVVKIMPKWKPGSQHEVPVKVKFTFPVTFEIPQ